MKYFFNLWLVLFVLYGQAQVYKADSVYIKFFSEAPLENIEAYNTIAKGLINIGKNEVAVVVPVKGFRFEKALMEEHFHENYMETEKYPMASFKGTFSEKIPLDSKSPFSLTLKGTLNIHGVEQPREINVTFQWKSPSLLEAEAQFVVKPADHRIKIPSLLIQNIAEEVEVKVKAFFSPR